MKCKFQFFESGYVEMDSETFTEETFFNGVSVMKIEHKDFANFISVYAHHRARQLRINKQNQR
jgi:hypothetical protein